MPTTAARELSKQWHLQTIGSLSGLAAAHLYGFWAAAGLAAVLCLVLRVINDHREP